MARNFDITSPATAVVVNSETAMRGAVAFTVKNKTGRALRVRARIVAEDPDQARWFEIDGDAERDLAAGAVHQYTVQVKVPVGIPEDSYTFYLQVYSVDQPAEIYTNGRAMPLHVGPSEAPPRRWRWWWLAAAVLVLCVGTIGLRQFFKFYTVSILPRLLIGKDQKEMVFVPKGTFTMGRVDTPTAQRHEVWIDSFYIDKYEVTVGEYKAFVQESGQQRLPTELDRYAPTDNNPIVRVSWDEAQAYCRWYGKQLPTEAQWEKAARGGDDRLYPWGDKAVDKTRANDQSGDDGFAYTAPVAHFKAGQSPYGVYNLAGNVGEWVQDTYDDTFYNQSPKRNPVNEAQGTQVVWRGGSWDDTPDNLRAYQRHARPPDTRDERTGFRCAVWVTASET